MQYAVKPKSKKMRYPRTEASKKQTTNDIIVNWANASLLGFLFISAVHAVSISFSHYPIELSLTFENVMNFLRILSPAMVEIIAAVALLGRMSNTWRDKQKMYATSIEILWMVFSGANLIVSFSEHGGTLPAMFQVYLNYGFPLCALIGFGLLQQLIKNNPDHMRQIERAQADEDRLQDIFDAEQAVYNSAQMQRALQNKTWLDMITSLKHQGYNESQLAFISRAVPQLRFGDGEDKDDKPALPSGAESRNAENVIPPAPQVPAQDLPMPGTGRQVDLSQAVEMFEQVPEPKTSNKDLVGVLTELFDVSPSVFEQVKRFVDMPLDEVEEMAKARKENAGNGVVKGTDSSPLA